MKLFAAAMGASNYIFAQARASEQIADWIGVSAIGDFVLRRSLTKRLRRVSPRGGPPFIKVEGR